MNIGKSGKEPQVEWVEERYDVVVPADDAVIGRALKRSLVALVAIIAVFFGVLAWNLRPTPPQPNVQSAARGATVREAPANPVPLLPFTDITQAAGLKFIHENGAMGDKLLPETMGGGGAFFDYNNDGHPDILCINSTFWPGKEPLDRPLPTMALFRNDGRGNFIDVTAEAGLDVSFYGQGVAVGDFDNDGWVDVFISAVGPNHLFHNKRGHFEDVTESAGVAGSERDWSTSCGWFDYDNDGDLDLFVCNYVRWSAEIDIDLKCSLVGGLRAYCRPDAFEGSFPYLYRNDGNGRFTDVSESAGIQVKNVNTGVPVAKSLGLLPIDFNGDGWLDIVVANDTVQNFLFRNEQDGTFKEIGISAGIGLDSQGNARGAMGIAGGFFRNDGTLGIAIGNFANEMTALYCRPEDSTQFTDDAIATGLGPPSRIWLKFGVCFLDADNDGRLDLLVANGHLENDIQKVQEKQRFEQPPQLYWNCGSEGTTEFLQAPPEKTGSDFAIPMVGRGATYADIDDDGDLDILLFAVGGTPRLLRNEQKKGHHWLRAKLIGRKSNHDAIGARVELHSGKTVRQRQVMPTCSYLSQVELPVTFGLGNETKVDNLIVYWPDGTSQELAVGAVDRMLTIEQAE